MGIAGAIEQVARFFNNLLELIPRRKKRGRISIDKTTVMTKRTSRGVSRRKRLKALRTLTGEIEWLPLQKDLPQSEVDICWALQLTFQLLRHSRDENEVVELLGQMRKLSFEKALKRFKSECPGLPSMLNVICHCCCTLYDEEEVPDFRKEMIKETSGSAVEVCRNLLLPFTKRKNTEELFPDAAVAIGNSINTLSKTLETYSRCWSEDLDVQLMRAVELVPSVLKINDLSKEPIRGNLREFANKIPSAFMILAKEHPEKWLSTLQWLCSRRLPENIHGPLCRIWRRLTVVSRPEGFSFLRNLIEVTFASVWTQVEREGLSGPEGITVAENIVGCVNDLVKQCSHCGGGQLGFYWHNQIYPVIEGYVTKREEKGRKADPVGKYLEQMKAVIRRLPKLQKKHRVEIGIKDLLTAVHDPRDSLCGVMGVFAGRSKQDRIQS